MRVAALYDIHGNLPSLEAVLAEVDADLILVGGDIVGGPSPGDTLERLRGLGDRVRWIRGNLERELRELPPPRPAGPPPGALEEMAALLSDEQLEFLYGLPEQQLLDVAELGRVLFCHATPRSDIEIVTVLTPDERLREILAGTDADAVVWGHTHVQSERLLDGFRIVNPGSVGMPYEDEPGAYWGLVGPGVELRRTRFRGEQPPLATRREASEYFESLVA